jgi:hypothetical protein
MLDFDDLAKARQGDLKVFCSGSVLHQAVDSRKIVDEKFRQLLPWALLRAHLLGHCELNTHLHSSKKIFFLFLSKMCELEGDKIFVQEHLLRFQREHSLVFGARSLAKPPKTVSESL